MGHIGWRVEGMIRLNMVDKSNWKHMGWTVEKKYTSCNLVAELGWHQQSGLSATAP